MAAFTLDAIGLVGFGFQFNATNTPNGEWVNTYNDVIDTTGKKHNNLAKLNNLFDEIIEHKKKELSSSRSEIEVNEKDLLTLMIKAGNGEDESIEPLATEDLRDELVLFFVARNPDKKCWMFLVMKNVSMANIRTIEKFAYLRKLMKESIRLAPPRVSLIERQAAVDTEISRVPLPKGALINVDVLGMHYNENLWKDPYKFDPEQFSIEAS
ncbi:unnamed protein product [Umbelopsis vinacea]